jgi:putative ABC transport system substrate-binding protein
LTGKLTVANLPDVAVKRLEILKEIIPRMTRVAVIWNPSSSNAQRESKGIKESASGLRLALHFYEAQTVKQLQNALSVIPKSSPDGLIVLNDPFVFTYRKNIAEFASQAKIPSIYGFSEYVTVGGLISYGTNIADTYRRAAAQVDKILKGAKPGDLPVELPRTLELMINKKTANALGVLIPNSILLRADKVIE